MSDIEPEAPFGVPTATGDKQHPVTGTRCEDVCGATGALAAALGCG